MKLWNVGNKAIEQLYNSKVYVIKPNLTLDVGDDVGLFLLNKREVRGRGLIELRDGDNRAECYKQGRKQEYEWALSKYTDYERHCEEREAIRLQPLKPHTEILEYKKTIDSYEEWQKEGELVKEEFQEIVGQVKVFICPHCSKEFSKKEDYFSHIPLHNPKEEVNADISGSQHTGQGKS